VEDGHAIKSVEFLSERGLGVHKVADDKLHVRVRHLAPSDLNQVWRDINRDDARACLREVPREETDPAPKLEEPAARPHVELLRDKVDAAL
jgi:hypothetical protein